MYFHLLAILSVVLILPFEVEPSNIQDVKDPWKWHRSIITPPSIRSTIIPPASRLIHISPLIPSSIPIPSNIPQSSDISIQSIRPTIIPPPSSPIDISSSIPIGSITPLVPNIPIPSIPPHLVEIHRVKRDFWSKLGHSVEKGFQDVRDAALPAAGAAIGASIGG